MSGSTTYGGGISSQKIFGEPGGGDSDAKSSASGHSSNKRSRSGARQKTFKSGKTGESTSRKKDRNSFSHPRRDVPESPVVAGNSLANVLQGLRRHAPSNPSTPNLSKRSSFASRHSSSHVSISDLAGDDPLPPPESPRSVESDGWRRSSFRSGIFGKQKSVVRREEEEAELRMLADLRSKALAAAHVDDVLIIDIKGRGPNSGGKREERYGRDLHSPAERSSSMSSYSQSIGEPKSASELEEDYEPSPAEQLIEGHGPLVQEYEGHRASQSPHFSPTMDKSTFSSAENDLTARRFRDGAEPHGKAADTNMLSPGDAMGDQAGQDYAMLAEKRRSTLRSGPSLFSDPATRDVASADVASSKKFPSPPSSPRPKAKFRKSGSSGRWQISESFDGSEVQRLGADSGTEADAEAEADEEFTENENENLGRRRSTIRPDQLALALMYATKSPLGIAK